MTDHRTVIILDGDSVHSPVEDSAHSPVRDSAHSPVRDSAHSPVGDSAHSPASQVDIPCICQARKQILSDYSISAMVSQSNLLLW